MNVYEHRRDVAYLDDLRERLTIDGPNGLMTRAIPIESAFESEGRIYDRCCRIDFAGISATNLFDTGENFAPSSVAECMAELFRDAKRLNEQGIFVKLRFLLIYPYSAYAFARIQAEASRNRASMKEPKYRRNLQLIESVDEETFQRSFLVRTQLAMLEQLQEWVDDAGWTATSINRAVVRFTPISPNLCSLTVNDTVFADAYLLAKRNRATTHCESLLPLVAIRQADNPSTFDAIMDHFRYLWDLDVTLDCEDATYYQRQTPGSLQHLKTPDIITFEAKATKLRNKVMAVSDEELRRWRFKVSRILRRYCVLPAPTPSAESLFITCSWKRSGDQRSVPNDGARELSRMIEGDFGRERPDKDALLSVHIMEGVAGEFLTQQLYSRLEEATLGLILMTSDLIGQDGKGYCKPNVYHELGYLMKHLRTERMVIVCEEGTELPSNIHDVIRIEFPKDKVVLAYKEIVEWLVKRCSFSKTVSRDALGSLKQRLNLFTTSGRITKAEGAAAVGRIDGESASAIDGKADLRLKLMAYMHRAGLSEQMEDASFIRAALGSVRHLLEVADDVVAQPDAAALYHYKVPKLNDDGSCSLELADEPFDLRRILGGEQAHTTRALTRLDVLIATLHADGDCGWLGIYQARNKSDGRVLVKLRYRGKPSRAEFPLTEEFAAHSNNSAVGLSGRARVIDDVASYLSEGGAYYTCDATVQAEACLPLFDEVGRVVGIVDAEDDRIGRFRGLGLAPFVALCVVAPAYLPR